MANLQHKGADPKTRRETPRFMCDNLRLSNGRVLDLSAGGMRVEIPYKPPAAGDEVFTVRLRCERGEVPFRVRVVWAKKTGWRSWQAGLSLVDAEDADRIQAFRVAWDPLGKGALSA